VLARAVVLSLTIVIAVYATILVANLGGYVDKVVKAHIDFALGDSRTMKGLSPGSRTSSSSRAKVRSSSAGASWRCRDLTYIVLASVHRWPSSVRTRAPTFQPANVQTFDSLE